MTAPDRRAGSLVWLPRSPGVVVGALVRPAHHLRLGDCLAFERDDDQPFRITPVRGDDYEREPRGVDLVWGQVTHLERLGSGGRWWRPPTFLLSVSCSFCCGASIITTLFNQSPVLLRPRRAQRGGVVVP